ncbi:MAG: septum formation initiator family protein [Candidatus Woesebacteria bacterium]|nr:septum formation initiator family protein [Candidatus Woesebacteria bacterium]
MSHILISEKLKQKFIKVRVYALILFVFLFGLSLFRNILKINEAKNRIQREKEKVIKLEEEGRVLEEELKKMQGNEYLESQLRDKLGLAKKGESVVILPDPETLKSLVPEIPDEKDYLPDPPYKKWLKLFDIKI